MRSLWIVLALITSGCVMPSGQVTPESLSASVRQNGASGLPDPAATFLAVIARIEPLAETACRARRPGGKCDIIFAVDDRPGQQANAFQTLDARGRPFVVLTASLIAKARNPDELAFVLGHEAAHHIAGHIPRRMEQAASGAMLAGVLAAASGLSGEEVLAVQAIGADLGARAYSIEFELEADALGAEIAWKAGFDPVRGAAFFDRLPDPGEDFRSTHPANADRQALVAATLRRLEGR